MKRLTVAISIGILLLSGCAVNQKIDYGKFRVNPEAIKANTIDVAILDHRDAVVTKKKKPTFVAYMRSSAGIPWTINTKKNTDFVDDLSNGIIESLKAKNIAAAKIKTMWMDGEDTVKNKMLSLPGDKKLFFVVHELHTDGYGKQTLHNNIDVYIYNKTGVLLANKSFKGETKLGGNAFWGPGDYKTYTPKLVSQFFDTMLNDPEILTAINTL